MAPGASALEEVRSRYSGREGGGDPLWGCGWGGGRGIGVHFGGWRKGEELAPVYEPSRGPRTVGVEGSRPERLALVQRRGVPPPEASSPDPPTGLRVGGPSSVSGAAAGTTERAGPDHLLKTRWRRRIVAS
ncbi:hypothetical protein HJG60_010243 [Phyllostomus discolor]|uniref:Uncharacterized protein n=1 Tax=Phyllostomus discolor TaxID=89673 RepID=A0A834EMR1_9CHIR|nr:hypothetical protein HJG60_010243 [Phyllostomus discolor]